MPASGSISNRASMPMPPAYLVRKPSRRSANLP
jgi:hypothetical protein